MTMKENDPQKKTLVSKVKSWFSSRKKDDSGKEKKRSLPKVLLGVFLWIIAALMACTLLILIFIDPFLNFSLTTVGSGVTGLNITLDNIELSLTDGTFKIVNLKVTNPEGFETETMLELGTFYASWDNDSLLTDKIIVHNIEVRKLYVNAEVSDKGKLNFIALAEKFVKPQTEGKKEPENPAPSAPPPQVWIEKFSIEDFKFNWTDKRKEFSIDGFGAALEKLEGSLTEGGIAIRNIKIANPGSFNIRELLAIEKIDIELDAPTLYSPAPKINKVAVSGLSTCAEFNKSGDFNVLLLVDSMENLFPAAAVEKEEKQAQAPAEETNDNGNTQPQAELKALSLSGWFHLEDDRLRIPVKIPLAYAMTDFQFIDTGDIEILPFLRKQAEFLKKTCSGVTNADQLALNFFSNAAESGVKLFKSAGQAIWDGAGKAGNVLVNGGSAIVDGSGKMLDSTHKSGKKVINKIVDIFD